MLKHVGDHTQCPLGVNGHDNVHVPEAHAHPWLQDPVLEVAEAKAVSLAVNLSVAVDLAVELHEAPQLAVADSEFDAPLKVCQDLNWYLVQPTCGGWESIW